MTGTEHLFDVHSRDSSHNSALGKQGGQGSRGIRRAGISMPRCLQVCRGRFSDWWQGAMSVGSILRIEKAVKSRGEAKSSSHGSDMDCSEPRW